MSAAPRAFARSSGGLVARILDARHAQIGIGLDLGELSRRDLGKIDHALGRAELDSGAPAAVFRAADLDRLALLSRLRGFRSFGGLGALGFAPKFLSAIDIVTCVRTVLAGEVYRPDPGDVSGSGLREPLTKREEEIVLLCASGLQNKEIGLRLGITVSAVEKHVAKAALFLAQHASEK